MNKLVVGCGYLGKRLARHWNFGGDHVFATTRSKAHAEEFKAWGWTPVLLEVTKPNLQLELPELETVVYAVGRDRSTGLGMREVYVQGLEKVLAVLPVPKKWIHISSTGVYGQQGGEEVDENAETKPLDEGGQIVLEAEQLLHKINPKAIILRLAGIYGPDRFLSRVALEKGQPLPGNPDKWLNLIHVEDAVGAILAAEEKAVPGEIYNICDNEPLLRRDFYSKMAQLLRSPSPLFPPRRESPSSRRELANRRICNRKMREFLNADLRYSSALVGLESCF